MTRIEQLRELRAQILLCPENAAPICGEVPLMRMEMCCDILEVLNHLPNEDLSCTRQMIADPGIANNILLNSAMTIGDYREVVLGGI